MSDQNQSLEIEIALLKEKQRQMEEHLENTDKLVDDLTRERNNALKYGIMALGGLLMTIGTWAITFVKDHLK